MFIAQKVLRGKDPLARDMMQGLLSALIVSKFSDVFPGDSTRELLAKLEDEQIQDELDLLLYPQWIWAKRLQRRIERLLDKGLRAVRPYVSRRPSLVIPVAVLSVVATLMLSPTTQVLGPVFADTSPENTPLFI